jgi:hypothetical protein
LIRTPGIDVGDREHQVAQHENQGRDPRDMPFESQGEEGFRNIPSEGDAKHAARHVHIEGEGGIGRRQTRQSGAGKNLWRITKRRGFPPAHCAIYLIYLDIISTNQIWSYNWFNWSYFATPLEAD